MKRKNMFLWIIGTLSILFLVVGCSKPEATPTLALPLANQQSKIDPSSDTSPESVTEHGETTPLEPLNSQKPVIFDDDGSRDGTVALLYLLTQPQIKIAAVTTSYGEAHPQVYTQHLGFLLDSLGYQDIPLGYGDDAPLGAGIAFPDWLREWSNGFWDYPLGKADKTFPAQPAAGLMVATLQEACEPVTIFMSGPCTTLAQALRMDASIREKIAAVYLMGGAVYVPGNIPGLEPESINQIAEWNIASDPQAAKEVFEAGLNLYLVPLDATNQVMFNKENYLPWYEGSVEGQLAADLYAMLFNENDFEEIEIFDLTAAVITVRPESCAFEPLYLDVITGAGNNSGQTLVVPGVEPNVQVCMDPDADMIKQALLDSFVGGE